MMHVSMVQREKNVAISRERNKAFQLVS